MSVTINPLGPITTQNGSYGMQDEWFTYTKQDVPVSYTPPPGSNLPAVSGGVGLEGVRMTAGSFEDSPTGTLFKVTGFNFKATQRDGGVGVSLSDDLGQPDIIMPLNAKGEIIFTTELKKKLGEMIEKAYPIAVKREGSLFPATPPAPDGKSVNGSTVRLDNAHVEERSPGLPQTPTVASKLPNRGALNVG